MNKTRYRIVQLGDRPIFRIEQQDYNDPAPLGQLPGDWTLVVAETIKDREFQNLSEARDAKISLERQEGDRQRAEFEIDLRRSNAWKVVC